MNSSGYVDLHTHSTYSDGLFTPIQIFQYAAKVKLRALSIADHDNIDCVAESRNAAKHYNIEYFPGIEISARHGDMDLHLLGYWFDPQNKALQNYIRIFQEERKQRAIRIVEKLNSHGIPISFDDVLRKSGNASIGRPHIVDVMIDNNIVRNRTEAFDKYLGDGCPCYVPKYKISPVDAIQMVHEAQGLIFIAHPGLDMDESNIYELVLMGIDGIETKHPRHAPSDIFYYQNLVRKYNLLESGGSDCHGDRDEEVRIGSISVSYRVVDKMKSRLKERFPNHYLLGELTDQDRN